MLCNQANTGKWVCSTARMYVRSTDTGQGDVVADSLNVGVQSIVELSDSTWLTWGRDAGSVDNLIRSSWKNHISRLFEIDGADYESVVVDIPVMLKVEVSLWAEVAAARPRTAAEYFILTVFWLFISSKDCYV